MDRCTSSAPNPVLPAASALTCLYLKTNLSIERWLRFLAWLVIGLVIHAAYGYRHSRLRTEERQRARVHSRAPVPGPSGTAAESVVQEAEQLPDAPSAGRCRGIAVEHVDDDR